MSQKPETVFRARLRKKLEAIPKSWWESIQQQTIIGTPDILGCIGPFFVAIEVKTDGGVASAMQLHKLNKIKEAGSLSFIVTPSTEEKCITFLNDFSNRLKEHQ